MAYPPLAGRTTESFTPVGIFADATDVITQDGTIASGAGTLVYLEVLGRVTATGKFIKHAPGASDGSQVAVALAAYPVDATAADQAVQIITAGSFQLQALTFNAGITTDAAKIATFPPGSAIVVKKAIYGTA